MNAQGTVTTDTTALADAEEMARALRKAVAASRATDDNPAPPLTVEDLPQLLKIFVALGILTLAQAQALLAAFEAGGDALLHLPDIPSTDTAYVYDSLKAFLAKKQESDSVFDVIGDALSWVADHLGVIVDIYHAIKSIIQSA